MSVAIARAIEIAEHNGWYEGPTLVVFDALKQDRYFGVRLRSSRQLRRSAGSSQWRVNGVGTAFTVHACDRTEAVTRALDGYLAIVKHGV